MWKVAYLAALLRSWHVDYLISLFVAYAIYNYILRLFMTYVNNEEIYFVQYVNSNFTEKYII